MICNTKTWYTAYLTTYRYFCSVFPQPPDHPNFGFTRTQLINCWKQGGMRKVHTVHLWNYAKIDGYWAHSTLERRTIDVTWGWSPIGLFSAHEAHQLQQHRADDRWRCRRSMGANLYDQYQTMYAQSLSPIGGGDQQFISSQSLVLRLHVSQSTQCDLLNSEFDLLKS